MRRAILVNTSSAYLTLDEVVEETGAREELIAELENFGIVQPEKRDGQDRLRRDRPRDRPRRQRALAGRRRAPATCASSAPRPTARRTCWKRCSGPSLRSRNPERRKEALESLESLAATVSHLKHLLLVRDLRRLAGD